MPHVPDQAIPAAHAGHDPELIAAYAAGDATGAELDTAAALVAGCPACAELHHDLRLITGALPAMPVPRRSRDFRLSAEQAASLRSSGWRRVLGVVAGPRFGFAAPLGTVLATLGLAGLLISGPGLPFATGGATAELAAPQAGAGALSNPAPEAPSAAPAAGDSIGNGVLAQGGAPAQGLATTAPPGQAEAASAAPAPSAGRDLQVPPASAATSAAEAGQASTPSPPSASSSAFPWSVVSALGLALGIGLLALGLAARRWQRPR